MLRAAAGGRAVAWIVFVAVAGVRVAGRGRVGGFALASRREKQREGAGLLARCKLT